jgi:DNA-binding transcriptional LysR family regulator
MEYAKLRHIVAVARAGSFSRAAEELHLTQPALSRSIAGFETHHGVRLFDRERSGVTLTASGKLVVEQAQAILSATGDLERNLRQYGRGEAGRIEIGLGPLLASLLLPTLSRSLLRSRPNLQVFTLTKPADQLLTELMKDNIEMIFGNSWHVSQLPNVINEPIGSLELAMIVRADHELANRGDLTMGDLAGFPVATAVELPAGGLVASSGAFICDNFHILREAVTGTDCVWLSAPAFVAEDLRVGQLVRLDIADLWPARTEICMVSRQGRSRSPVASAITEDVREILARIERQG